MLQLFRRFKNPKGHPNPITGSEVTAILLNGWIAHWWSIIRKGLHLQPAKQACFL
jgi:hypothetical protein